MTVLAVESSASELQALRDTLGGILDQAELLCYTSSPEALAAARGRQIDVAFLDPELPELSGLDLGTYLQEMSPAVNLIFLSGRRDFAYDALSRHASGYLLTPFAEDALRRELTDLRRPAGQAARPRVFAQTFGNFEFFVDGRPVAFKYSRTKEIVALLINNRGAQTTNGEIIAALWEDDGDPEKKGSYLSNLRQDLQNTLTKLRLNDIIVKQRGSLGIAADRIECDLYEWLAKKKESRYQYMGDYMNQYSWAEDFHAELDELSWAMDDE